MLKKLLFASLFLFNALAFAGESVNINSADAATLANALKGIGPVKAEAIVAYREEHGPFKSVDDLVMVQGIGEKTVEMNRESLDVGMPSSAQ
ncbi:MAG: ComEA family DNA-binding protein [Gammaproteobacteria bacterium]